LKRGIVYLIPSVIAEEANETIPPYVVDAVKDCQTFFVENERTARRFLKSIWKEMVIDDYSWHAIHKAESGLVQTFRNTLKEGKNVGIISEAGCPGIADPGQILIAAAQEMRIIVKPLVGPSSILLALMASGMNGQQFCFHGYLPIDAHKRSSTIKELEQQSAKNNCTQIFIETPYRNNAMMQDLLKHCRASTKICVAVNITGKNELIVTKSAADWKKQLPELHKVPAIFLMMA
jgi:16S rRNA (cytidine1402-2'-O)-methyltransferase